jgi:DNA end-binding protein Ku
MAWVGSWPVDWPITARASRINRKTGNRLKQQNVDSETGEVVSRDDMVRGYEIAKGHFMIVEE